MGTMEQSGPGYGAEGEYTDATGLGHGTYFVRSGAPAFEAEPAAAQPPASMDTGMETGDVKPRYRHVLPVYAGAALVNGYHQEAAPGYNGVHVTPAGAVYEHTGWIGM